MAFEHGNEDGPLYVDYCDQQNGKLARLASVPTLQTKCDDAYFRCQSAYFRYRMALLTERPEAASGKRDGPQITQV